MLTAHYFGVYIILYMKFVSIPSLRLLIDLIPSTNSKHRAQIGCDVIIKEIS